jgi:hypothetical protein
MSTQSHETSLEEQIDQWRSYLRRRQAIHTVDVAELEDHLREQVSGLVGSGLAEDEAFLVAVKRMGDLDAVSREFAREHSDRLWKQLVVGQADAPETRASISRDGVIAFALAVAAGVLVKLPEIFGLAIAENPLFYVRNASFFVLPLLVGYFAWKRQLRGSLLLWVAVAFVAGAAFINAYPFVTPVSASGEGEPGHTLALAMLHLPIALWLAVGVAYAAKRWKQSAGRMDFIRFTGELFIYYVLIALGGGVLTGFTLLIFQAIGMNAEFFVQSWLLPCGAAGAVLVASWLVEAKQSVIENMAPVLTRLFTPLFAAVLITFLVTVLLTGRAGAIERDMLIAFDLLLVVVLGLLLYSVSARDPGAPAGFFDVLQVVLVISALLVDAVALWAIAARITEYGFTPNRTAALGMNVILLVNLAWSAVLYIRFLRRRESFATLEHWQTNYLPVYAAWAAIVVIVFPPLFRYI